MAMSVEPIGEESDLRFGQDAIGENASTEPDELVDTSVAQARLTEPAWRLAMFILHEATPFRCIILVGLFPR
jgi:hypothetical protein